MQSDFFSKYNIDPLAFDRTGLKWSELESLGDDYDSRNAELARISRRTVEKLMHCSGVHSINYRIKEREHLIEKIIRKTIAGEIGSVTVENYTRVLNDLIGIRLLHLFKEDWTQIHNYLKENWEFLDKPTAFIRPGDPNRLSEFYRDQGCSIKEHPHGYRSVHYQLQPQNPKKGYTIEIQTRTIFEEAWGEIDHFVRYPYHADNELLGRLSVILNRLSADADELGTYMRFLKNQQIDEKREHEKELQSKNAIIDSLRRQINELSIGKEEKSALKRNLEVLQESETKAAVPEDYPWLTSLMETDIFKRISGKVEELVQEAHEDPIPITMEDYQKLLKAQKGLAGLLNNPQELQNFLDSQNGNTQEDKEKGENCEESD